MPRPVADASLYPKAASRASGNTSRIVFRITSDELHTNLCAFVESERVRTGWPIGHNDVVERALREFLDRQSTKGKKR